MQSLLYSILYNNKKLSSMPKEEGEQLQETENEEESKEDKSEEVGNESPAGD
jgi:hypothetical protein